MTGWYGWTTTFSGVLFASLAGAIYGGVQILRRRADRKSALPFGPMMLLGTLLSVMLAG
ncbi:hypothetical protein [Streptomyces sp. NPDC004296]|uniref:hypothetical protein n=1 Tax=Streptomyces sp. NPDC004296 TaxID=3364697 RepID=UPI003679E103